MNIYIIERISDYFNIETFSTRESALEYINNPANEPLNIYEIIEGNDLDLIKVESVVKWGFK